MTPERELLELALKGIRPAVRQCAKTRIEYAADWKSFTAFCKADAQSALPAAHATVLTYCHELLSHGRKVSTLQRHLSAINSYHRAAGYPAPAGQETRQFLNAVKRLRAEQPAQKRPLTLAHLQAALERFGNDLIGIRNRAILLLGFASSLRRGNLVALDLADVDFRLEGLVLTLRREKQNRTGEARLVAVSRGKHLCAVGALEAWVAERGDAPGPLFVPVYRRSLLMRRLHPERIAHVVKLAAEHLGLNPAAYAGHSMRAGFITTCINNGLSDLMIAQHTGHRKIETLRIYHRRVADPFAGSPTALIDL